MTRKLIEHTYGSHVYMKLQLDNGITAEIDAYIRETGWSYHTSVDGNPALREAVIAAFNELY